MKGFTKGVVWTIGSLFLLVIVLAIIGVVAYNGYQDAALKAEYSNGDKKTIIKIEKKEIKKSTEQTNFDVNELKLEDGINIDKEEIITLKKCYKIDDERSVTPNLIGKFDKDRFEVAKYIINKKLNKVTRVWILTDKEIEKRKKKQKVELKENVSIFNIIYIDDFVVKAKSVSSPEKKDWSGEVTINLKRNTVKTDFGSLNGKDFWSEDQCIKHSDKTLNAEKTLIGTDEKYYALVVGNNDYKHLEKLDAAENDAVVISDILKKKIWFRG